MKVKTILVSQPEPKEHSPYFDLSEKQKVKIDFRSFIHVEGVSVKEIRAHKIDLKVYTAVILTSRNAVDHFFRVAEEMRFKVPDDMKYFCQSEAVAFYLQKYVVYRKRKIYIGQRTFPELGKLIKKHKTENFLLPSSDKLKDLVPQTLNDLKVNWTRINLYKTVVSDLSDLENVFYDILVFFSPSGIDSLFQNFPNFKQNDTRIAVFGNSTVKAASATGYNLKRLNMILAVLEKRAGFRLGAKDVFLNITGGIHVDDPAIDLAVISAILSSNNDEAIPQNYCFAAEIGLAGEIRAVNKIEQRISEAEKLGFDKVFVSKFNKISKKNRGISVVPISKIEDLYTLLF